MFYNQENLIQCTVPDSLQVSTKDMDSTLSKASRAIKKTSKKVTQCVLSQSVALERSVGNNEQKSDG